MRSFERLLDGLDEVAEDDLRQLQDAQATCNMR
jgi:hypothetical protein